MAIVELIHYFKVQKIIRIGTCGAVSKEANIGDIILADSVYSESNFAYTFNDYCDRILERIPKEYEILGEEMEAFGLIHVANSLGAKATAMATVVDSKFSDVVLTPEEREKNLNDMIVLGLETIIK